MDTAQLFVLHQYLKKISFQKSKVHMVKLYKEDIVEIPKNFTKIRNARWYNLSKKNERFFSDTLP